MASGNMAGCELTNLPEVLPETSSIIKANIVLFADIFRHRVGI